MSEHEIHPSFPRRPRGCCSLVLGALLAVLALFPQRTAAAALPLGDVNRDGAVNLLDMVVLINHLQGLIELPAPDRAFADTDHDGLLTRSDLEVLANSILGLAGPLGDLPLTRLRETSPRQGEGQVAVTRETVFRLTQPLSADAVIPPSRLHADFGGRRILARTELSTDRQTVTLFYLEPLPPTARLRVTFDGNGLRDLHGRDLDLDGDGAPGGVATVDFDTLTLTLFPGTRVVGRVFASELSQRGDAAPVNYPLEGVTITVDGQEEKLRTTTDKQGNFRLDPAPAGAFFVHIDGRTAVNAPVPTQWPEGPYFPTVGKAWQSIGGEEVVIGNIYLPLVSPGTLQAVSATATTEVRFPAEVLRRNPELAGVTLEVPPNSLFSDNGTRGGRVGIAPVAPDRIPSPLPPGLNFPLVITVQTDGGSNFDRPVPVCFPNLPDPVTGVLLAPGEKAALWSFNHDLGDWEVVGPMTVSADGKLVCSDPGVGILQPGWHGVSQGTQGEGGEIQKLVGSTRPDEKPGKTIPRGDPGNEIRIPCPEHKNRYVILYRDRKRPSSTDPKVADPVYLFNGEFYHEEIDLWIPGRGFDFVWSRKYRSQFPVESAMGVQWDFSYNIFLEKDGDNFVLQEGTARNDFYFRQPDGTWLSQGLFRRLSLNPDGTLALTFESLNRWLFNPLTGPAAGRIRRIEDRNGNVMRFEYDGAGRLTRILDTLDRQIRVGYGADGRIARLTDFAGREVLYEHFSGVIEGQGGPGDLRSVTTPAVRNSVTGNDFPAGKKRTYTYTTDATDERLNHNLVSITDGRRNDPNDPTFGQGPYLVNFYSAELKPDGFGFDRLVRQQWGYTWENYDFVYERPSPNALNGFAVTTAIVRDREGHVKEYHFDKDNQLVALAEFTGRSRIDQPVDRINNRPVDRLRSGDPGAFITRYTYNADFQLKRMIFPNGNYQENIYESDLNPRAEARTRGNLRKVRLVPGGGIPGLGAGLVDEQRIIEESYEYAANLGDCCTANFVTRHVDGDGNITRYEYDARGNQTRILIAEPGAVMDFRYNEFGQLIEELYPPAESGRRRDAYAYHAEGIMRGYRAARVQDADNLQLTTRFEYAAVGNLVAFTDPKGNRQEAIFNERNQLVRQFSPELPASAGVRYSTDYHYDANDKVVRVDQLNVDEAGRIDANRHISTRFEYEILDNVTRIIHEIDETRTSVEEFAYDRSRNRVFERTGEAVNGHQPNNALRTIYDERDRVFWVSAGPGDPSQITTQFDYDGNGNLIRRSDGVDQPEPRVTRYGYDGFDRRIRVEDAMGNEKLSTFDRRHNLIGGLTRGELADQPGSARNIRLAQEDFTYDRLNRLVNHRVHHFDPATQQPVGSGFADTRYEFNAASLLVRMTDANGRVTTSTYDTVYRPLFNHDSEGSGSRFEYDANSNLRATVRTDRVENRDESLRVEYAHDPLNRLVQIRDPNGATLRFAYNSRSRRTKVEDMRRGNLTRIVYDGLDRITEVSRELTATGEGTGARIGAIVTRKTYDDNGNLLTMTDGNGNVGRYEYDSRNRQTRYVYPDGAVEAWQRNPFGDTTAFLDPNGTRSTSRYDLAGRLIERIITPAAGVAGTTTRQSFVNDGVWNLRRMQDDLSVTGFDYDSLSRRTAELSRGRTTRVVHDGLGIARRYTYPGGRQITVELDPLNRPSRFLEGQNLIAQLHYRGSTRLAGMEFGNGTLTGFGYDELFRINRVTHAGRANQAFLDTGFTRDPMDNRTESRDLLGGPARSFAYDSVNRLVASRNGPFGDRTYRYDAVGNRTSVDGNVIGGNYSPGAPDSATQKRNLYATTPFGARAYDGRGSLSTVDGTAATYEYDFANRLVRHRTAAGLDVRYVYDPLGRRIEKRVAVTGSADEVTRYHYLGLQLLEEQDGAGNTVASYVYRGGLDTLLQARIRGRNLFYHSDDHGSVQALTDDAGAVVESYLYDDFGLPRILDAQRAPQELSVVGNNRMFQGREFDEESGLYYFRARYLDPLAGRFITHDPMGLWFDSVNHGNGYTFAGNNPHSMTDPLGLETPKEQRDRVSNLREVEGSRSSKSRNHAPYREVTPSGSRGVMMRRPLDGSSGLIDYGGHYLTEGVGAVFALVVPEVFQPNWSASHEQYFTWRYQSPDGKGNGTNATEDDYGFGVGAGGDTSVTREKLSEYNHSVDSEAYYDDIMDYARDMIHDDWFDTISVAVTDEDGNPAGYRESYVDKGYSTFWRNCQHYADELRSWYDHLLKRLCEGSAGFGGRARFGDADAVDMVDPNPRSPWYPFWYQFW